MTAEEAVELQPAPEPAPSPPAPSADRYLNIVISVLLVALLGLGAYFTYDVMSTRAAERAANPAYKVLDQMKAKVRKNRNDPEARGLLAEAYAAVGEYDGAKRELKTALKLDPKYVGAYMAVAKIGFIQKDFDTARKALKKVLELTAGGDYEGVNKRREEAYFYLGELALESHHYEEALGDFKAALRIRRDASDTYLRLAQAYVGLGENDAALNALQAALAFDPKFPEANYEMGKLLLPTDKAAAAERLRIALDGQPDAESAGQALASLGAWESYADEARKLLDAGKPAEALLQARIARALEPKEYEPAMLKARALEALGKTDDAIAAYRETLNLRADDQAVQAAISRLSSQKKGGAK